MSVFSSNDPDNLHFFAPKDHKRGYNLRLGRVWDNPRLNQTHNGSTPIRYVHQENGTVLVQAWDYTDRCYRNPRQYTKQQKSVLRNALSGLTVGMSKNERIVFATFTSYFEQKGYYDKTHKKRIVKTQEEADFNYRSRINALMKADRQLMKNFDREKDFIENNMQRERFAEWLWKEHKLDYFNKNAYDGQTRREIRKLKKENFWRFKYRLKYRLIRTAEGGGVLHILIRKPRDFPPFPIQEIKTKWQEITGNSYEVFIKEIPYDLEKPLEENAEAFSKAFYMAGYYTYQPIVRQSGSRNWIFQGANRVWSRGKEILGIKKTKSDSVSETRYDFDEKSNDWLECHIIGNTTRKITSPNVVVKRESLIEIYGVKPGQNRSSEYRLLADPKLVVSEVTHVYEFNYLGDKWYREFKLLGVVNRKPFLLNVMHVWKTILRNPPPSTYQTHLARKITKTPKSTKKGIRSKPLPKPIIRFNSYGGGVKWLLF